MNQQPESVEAGANQDKPRGGHWSRAVLGELRWQPPGWAVALAARIDRNRPAWAGAALVLIALVALATWWLQRPAALVPDAISVAVTAPRATDYHQTPARIDTLRLRFSAPAAPLEAIGAAGERSREPAGLSLAPAHPGTWTWLDDRQLQFTPAADWPIGQTFNVRIDPRQALAPGMLLPQTRHSFDTAPFSATLVSSEFYQDPEDPALKRGVFTVRFSHPVDAGSLRSRLRLALADGSGRALAAPDFGVRMDEGALTAWVQSDPLAVPDNGGQLTLELAAGVHASLPGRGGAEALTGIVALPTLYSVAMTSLQANLVDNERHEPEQVLSLEFNQALRDEDVAGALQAWLLPSRREPRTGESVPARGWPEPYRWAPGEIDEALLAASEPLALELLPPEHEWSQSHSFRYRAPPGRRIHLTMNREPRSFGGFAMARVEQRVVEVPPYPQLLRFVGEGSLLSLRGERRVTMVARNMPGIRLEVGRVLPGQLHHLAAGNRGRFSQPDLRQLGVDALVERFETRLEVPGDDPARAHYAGVDLGEFLTPSRRGVFLLSLNELSEADRQLEPAQTLARNAGREHDRRLVVLTDLGVIAKRGADGSREVFVQSLSGGGPVADAQVRVIARNGEALITRGTDAQGRAALPPLEGFVRERHPVMLSVSQGEDLSFLPLDSYERLLDTSRFDVGGEPNDRDAGALRATLFSDRGLYRPGETVHVGMILRAADWERSPSGLPVELVVTDPRGSVARRERIAFGREGFEEASFTPAQSAASGPWQVALYLLGREQRRTWIGGTQVQVREFAPDTLKLDARLSSRNPDGWVHPAALSARVRVENLFGTPAQDRRVEGRLSLRPILPSFPRWPGFRFHDPRRASEGVSEDLEATRTDSDGHAEFALGLERYENATYRLELLARAFEPGSGRAVAARTTALVSEADYLLGVRSPEPLHWIHRGEPRGIELLAIGPDGAALAVEGLQAVLIERRFVSVLTRGNDGLYRYVSRERRDERRQWPLPMDAAVQPLALDTQVPGDWTLEVRDVNGLVLNSIDWTVAGAADLSRSMDRNAELAITLSKPSYAPGEEIELSLRAPYAGRGLITIERDRVHAHAWFEAGTTASVQRIRVPDDLEGNAYVSVQYLRDPGSAEIFTSPLSWGVVPFEIDREARTLPVTLQVPETARPGEQVTVQVGTPGPARVAVFAVDEGILQVANYRVPDPLDHFFLKRMHEVGTAQILDLLLPEFSRFQAMAAAGGDGEGSGARHLNPFKRRGEAPAVWWSGLVDSDGDTRLHYTMPDHFNGRLRVVAVAVAADRIGIAEDSQQVRGDFVLSPTVPTHVAPGDVFELPVGIANTLLTDDDAAMPVELEVELPPLLQRSGDTTLRIQLRPGEEGVLGLRLRAGDAPGVASIALHARSGTFSASRRIELSIRPEVVPRTSLRVARVEARSLIDGLRDMHQAHSRRSLSASPSPLVAIDAYAAFLSGFAHACTEQLVSMSIPGLVQHSRPEFQHDAADADALARTFNLLRTRQNAQGGFGLWRAGLDADPFVSTYTTLALLEARERGLRVPADMIDSANGYLRALAGDAALASLPEQRARALAVYLLSRQGQSVGDLLATLQSQLERDHPGTWRDDTAGALVAASFSLMRQDRAAQPLARRVRELASQPLSPQPRFAHFSDPQIDHAWRVYLLHRHFPAEARRLPAAAVEALLEAIREERYNTLSAALTVLALDAVGDDAAPAPVLEAAAAGAEARPIGEVQGQLRRALFEPDDQRLWVTPGDGAAAWYALAESGFDRVAPPALQDRGLEVLRDYLDATGQPTTHVALGGELVVRLRVRARGGEAYSDIAISDLLPGGFELVREAPAPASPEAPDDEGDAEADAGDSEPRTPQLALPGSSFVPEHAEMREDRLVLYGQVRPEMREFRYRIRAGSQGEFAIPPVHAESMYRRDIIARGGPAGTLTVTAPQP